MILLFALDMLDDKTRGPDEPKCDAKKHPVVILNFAKVIIFVQDPDVIQDIYSGKGSKIIDKTNANAEAFAAIFPDFFAL